MALGGRSAAHIYTLISRGEDEREFQVGVYYVPPPMSKLTEPPRIRIPSGQAVWGEAQASERGGGPVIVHLMLGHNECSAAWSCLADNQYLVKLLPEEASIWCSSRVRAYAHARPSGLVYYPLGDGGTPDMMVSIQVEGESGELVVAAHRHPANAYTSVQEVDPLLTISEQFLCMRSPHLYIGHPSVQNNNDNDYCPPEGEPIDITTDARMRMVGNSLLVQCYDAHASGVPRYYYLGHTVFEFRPLEPIINYHSHVGPEGPSAVAVSENYVYLMRECAGALPRSFVGTYSEWDAQYLYEQAGRQGLIPLDFVVEYSYRHPE